MKRVSLLSVFIILMLPVYGFSEPVSKCYTADKFLLKTSYDKSKTSKYGINHQLFISYNKGDLLDIRYLVDQLDKNIRSGRMPAQYAWEWLIGVIL